MQSKIRSVQPTAANKNICDRAVAAISAQVEIIDLQATSGGLDASDCKMSIAIALIKVAGDVIADSAAIQLGTKVAEVSRENCKASLLVTAGMCQQAIAHDVMISQEAASLKKQVGAHKHN